MPHATDHPLDIYRKKKNLTYERLAKKIGVYSVETIRSWCRSRRRMSYKARVNVVAATRVSHGQIAKYEQRVLNR